jgi:hypothetical protein
MFVQVFQAKVRDADLWARQVAAWRREIRPKTTGFLGFTSGVTPDGHMITAARFKSEESAQVDNDLPEQGAWFEKTSKAFDGDVTFHDCRDVDVMFEGGSNKAGFVQIMQGRAKDQQDMRAQEKAMEDELHKIRPDLIGGFTAWHGDRSFTQVVYFSSEQEARKNEQAMSPLYEQFLLLIDGDLTFYDLPKPDLERRSSSTRDSRAHQTPVSSTGLTLRRYIELPDSRCDNPARVAMNPLTRTSRSRAGAPTGPRPRRG